MNMTNSERRFTSVPGEANGQGQTTPDHITVASVSLSALLKVKICSRNSKNIHRRNFNATDTYKLGTGTPTFGTRFHHNCTILYQVPPLWYHGTTTLPSPSIKFFPRFLENHLLPYTRNCMTAPNIERTGHFRDIGIFYFPTQPISSPVPSFRVYEVTKPGFRDRVIRRQGVYASKK